MTCIVCGAPGHPFCGVHQKAPAGQRGGWLSSHRRKLALADHEQAPLEPIDANQIVRRLWIGSKPPVDRRLPGFSAIALCAQEYQPEKTAWTGRILRARLDDAVPSQAEILQAVTAARQVAEEMRRGGRVLVTCYMGLNRSALVAAMSLLMQTPRATPDLIIRRIRERRSPDALSNASFVKVLHSLWSSRVAR